MSGPRKVVIMADTKETSDGLRAEVARYVTKMASSKLPGPKINILSILRSSDGDLFAARVLLATEVRTRTACSSQDSSSSTSPG
jgi:hypothetical protein